MYAHFFRSSHKNKLESRSHPFQSRGARNFRDTTTAITQTDTAPAIIPHKNLIIHKSNLSRYY